MTLHKVNLLISDAEILVSSGCKYDSTVFVRPGKSPNEKDFIICGHVVTCINLCAPLPTDKLIWPIQNGKVIDEKYASMLLRYIIKENSPWDVRKFTEVTLCVSPNLETKGLQTLKCCCGDLRVKFIYKPIAFLRQLKVANGIVISMEDNVVCLSVFENNQLITVFSDDSFIDSIIQSIKNMFLNRHHTIIWNETARCILRDMLSSSTVVVHGPDCRYGEPNEIKLSFCEYILWFDNVSQGLYDYIVTSLLEIINEHNADIYFYGEIETAAYLKDYIYNKIPGLRIILQENTVKIALDGVKKSAIIDSHIKI